MARFEITGKRRLKGSINVQGSKNAVLPIMAACVLTEKTVVLKGCPLIKDTENLKTIMEELGVVISRDGHDLTINAEKISSYTVLGDKVGSLRSSVLLIGPLLGRVNKVLFSMPGGCAIGKRPIDLHLKAMERLNCTTSFLDGVYCCHSGRLKGNEIEFSYPSVGATENAVMASVLAEGTTVIKGAAKEPEITALCDFLNTLGAGISGQGTEEITIKGVTGLVGGTYSVPSDRIVTGTYLCAGAVLGEDINIITGCKNQVDKVVDTLRSMGAGIYENKNGFNVRAEGVLTAPKELATGPYPGFPTDMQSIFLPLLSVAVNDSRIEETVFESRYATVNELMKMGALMEKNGKCLMVKGQRELVGADVYAPDLRGGAALVMAGLMADGKTRVFSGENIIRGYEDLAGDLRSLGADIVFVP